MSRFSPARRRYTFLSWQAPQRLTAKDLILAIIGKIGIGGGNGHVAEYGGESDSRPFDGTDA